MTQGQSSDFTFLMGKLPLSVTEFLACASGQVPHVLERSPFLESCCYKCVMSLFTTEDGFCESEEISMESLSIT
jgi:hypothetical protein